MNICFVSHSSDIGGAERSLLHLINELKYRYNIEVFVVLPSYGPMCKSLDQLHIKYIIQKYDWWVVKRGVKRDRTTKELDRYYKYSEKITKAIRPLKPNIIVTNTSVICVGAIAANILDIPHIWYIRELGEKDHGFIFKFGFAFTAKFINDYSSKLIFNSQATRKEFCNYIDIDKTEVIYNAISIDSDNKDVPVYKYNFRDSFKLLIAGTISRKKGQLDAIRATLYLINRNFNIELLILGRCTDTKLYSKINNLIKNIPRIKIYDFVENPYPIFKMCNVILVCSKNEAFGRTIIEGMLLKKPVIASNTGGVPEIIQDNVNGILYNYGKYLELAKKISNLIENEQFKNRIVNAGYQTAINQFSEDQYSGKFMKIVKKIMG